MKKNLIDNSVILLILFLLLQLGGQTAAGFAGNAGGNFNIFTLLSYCALLLRGFVWILVLKRMPLIAAYPFTGAVYILVLPLSILLFGETPHWSRFAGAFLIFAGIGVSALGAVKNEN